MSVPPIDPLILEGIEWAQQYFEMVRQKNDPMNDVMFTEGQQIVYVQRKDTGKMYYVQFPIVELNDPYERLVTGICGVVKQGGVLQGVTEWGPGADEEDYEELEHLFHNY